MGSLHRMLDSLYLSSFNHPSHLETINARLEGKKCEETALSSALWQAVHTSPNPRRQPILHHHAHALTQMHHAQPGFSEPTS